MLLAAVASAGLLSADLPVQVVFKGNPKAKPTERGCVSWWGPTLLHTNSNTTIICAACKPNARDAPVVTWVSRSTSAGRTWSEPEQPPGGCGDMYSRTSNTIFRPGGLKKHGDGGGEVAAADTELIQASAGSLVLEGEFERGGSACSPCCEALHKYCGAFASKGAACLKCEHEHAAALKNSSACADDPGDKMERFCGAAPAPPGPPAPGPHPHPHPPPGPPIDIYKPIWAHQLPQLTPAQLAKCESSLSKSTDDGQTWSAPSLLQVNNSLGPHYIGGGLNHGIQLRGGPHAGRLAMARRFDCHAAMGDHGMQQYFHSYILFSDDNGEHWTAGQLSPQGWTECQVAELKNGSLLMTSRMYGTPYLTPGKDAKRTDLRRGFARSDDGGYTWSEIWYLEKRQPEIMVGTCAHALSSDPATGTVFYSHPGNWTEGTELARANYTLQKSVDGGATWQFVNRVYGPGPPGSGRSGPNYGGAGYSDSIVIPDSSAPGGATLLMGFQKTFEPPVAGVEGGGYDMAVALLPL